MKAPSRPEGSAHPFLKWHFRGWKSLLVFPLGDFLNKLLFGSTGEVEPPYPKEVTKGNRRLLKRFESRAPSHLLSATPRTGDKHVPRHLNAIIYAVKIIPVILYGQVNLHSPEQRLGWVRPLQGPFPTSSPLPGCWHLASVPSYVLGLI